MGVSSLYISLSQFTIFFFQENQKETKSDSYFSFNTVCSSLHARGWESWKGQKLEAWVVLCKLWSLTLKPLRRVEKKRKSILFKRLGWRNLDVDLPHLTCKKKNWKGKKKSACIVRHICFYRDCTKFTNITYMFHNFLFPISMY